MPNKDLSSVVCLKKAPGSWILRENLGTQTEILSHFFTRVGPTVFYIHVGSGSLVTSSSATLREELPEIVPVGFDRLPGEGRQQSKLIVDCCKIDIRDYFDYIHRPAENDLESVFEAQGFLACQQQHAHLTHFSEFDI